MAMLTAFEAAVDSKRIDGRRSVYVGGGLISANIGAKWPIMTRQDRRL
jgi:hypothetical protein